MKNHYEALDGLRGTAALCVFMFHFVELITPDTAHNPIRHSYLAVDFFFVLSGFVLSHSYDERLSTTAGPKVRLRFKDFFVRRLIRLHPMVVVGVTLGLIGFLLDPNGGQEQRVGIGLPLSLLLSNFGLNLLMLPAPSLPNYFGMTHSLDGPSWSLTQEYLGSFLYGGWARRGSLVVLGAVYFITAAGLVVSALQFGTLSTGWGWDNVWPAPVRLGASFSAGILIHRLNLKLRLPSSYPVLSLILLAAFAAPELPAWHGMLDVLCVLVLFPLVVMAGATVTTATGLSGTICRLTGRLSYPVYIIHYPFIMLFAHWNWSHKPSTATLWLVLGSTYAGVILLAWLLLTYFDEPLRAWLTSRASPGDSTRPTAAARA